jgi:hypothetical protein
MCFKDSPGDRRPQLRGLLSGLAGAIKRWYGKQAPSVQIPAGIVAWETSCGLDPLPEVRRGFNQWDSLDLYDGTFVELVLPHAALPGMANKKH